MAARTDLTPLEALAWAFARAAEHRDPEVGDHLMRIAGWSRAVAGDLVRRGRVETGAALVEHIAAAAMLHDVGKIATPREILEKPGALDPRERRVMEEHAATGAEIIAEAAAFAAQPAFLEMARGIARSHHECVDGSGYPDGLAGEDIPLAARIVAVADVYDALTQRRPYKEPWPADESLAYLRDNAGRQFDVEVVEAFAAVVGKE